MRYAVVDADGASIFASACGERNDPPDELPPPPLGGVTGGVTASAQIVAVGVTVKVPVPVIATDDAELVHVLVTPVDMSVVI